MKRFGFALAAAALFASAARAQHPSTRNRRPPAHEYGRVLIDNASSQAKLPPVAFDHWVHRTKFTCRLCHVDVGFAMRAGATRVRAADNAAGMYCGACHDGRTASDGKRSFQACSKPFQEVRPGCLRCHSVGKSVKPERDFAELAKSLPRERFGNGIDWDKAEAEKLIRPADHLEGISIRRPPMPVQKDFALGPKLEGIPTIIFSHAKHTVWNGCELCHPDIFMGVKRGATKYSMVDIFEGKYCGVCHATVAFPLLDCQRCHSTPVR